MPATVRLYRIDPDGIVAGPMLSTTAAVAGMKRRGEPVTADAQE
jgi:hypothetical protein